MKTPKYICAKCRLPFSRRWNAYRHCNNKHEGAIENIVTFTDYITNEKGFSSDSLNHIYENKTNPHNNLKK